MSVHKVIAGSVLTAGLGVAGLMGAGTASAVGFSFDSPATDPVTQNFGPGGSASTSVGDTDTALAVALGQNASVETGTNSAGHNLVAINGNVSLGNNATNNNVLTVGGDTTLKNNAADNTLVTVGTGVDGKNDVKGVTTLAVCGFSFTGQADSITLSNGCF
jgi:hypothetical protein